MTGNNAPDLQQITCPDQIGPELAEELVDCWITVSNAGGAAGFPFLPVDHTHVAPVAQQLIAGLAPQRSRLVLATVDGLLAGWLNIRRGHRPA